MEDVSVHVTITFMHCNRKILKKIYADVILQMFGDEPSISPSMVEDDMKRFYGIAGNIVSWNFPTKTQIKEKYGNV